MRHVAFPPFTAPLCRTAAQVVTAHHCLHQVLGTKCAISTSSDAQASPHNFDRGLRMHSPDRITPLPLPLPPGSAHLIQKYFVIKVGTRWDFSSVTGRILLSTF